MKNPQQLLVFLKSLSFTEGAGSVTQCQCTICIVVNSIIYQLILWSVRCSYFFLSEQSGKIRFTKLYRATIGVDFLAKEVTIDKRSVILQVRYIYIHLGLLNPQDLKHKKMLSLQNKKVSTD